MVLEFERERDKVKKRGRKSEKMTERESVRKRESVCVGKRV